ncbi:MAG: hypothetical protein HQ559_12825, partial [Lentisphaerae bacterium]|nr:hypothetical protein [Lentisphaerota bacterium]
YQSPAVLLMSVAAFLLAREIANKRVEAGAAVGGKLLADAVSSVLGIYLVHPLLIRGLRELGVGGSFIHPAFGVPVVSLLVFAGAWAAITVARRIPLVRRTVS